MFVQLNPLVTKPINIPAVCVCERETEREREKRKERESVCVCIYGTTMGKKMI